MPRDADARGHGNLAGVLARLREVRVGRGVLAWARAPPGERSHARWSGPAASDGVLAAPDDCLCRRVPPEVLQAVLGRAIKGDLSVSAHHMVEAFYGPSQLSAEALQKARASASAKGRWSAATSALQGWLGLRRRWDRRGGRRCLRRCLELLKRLEKQLLVHFPHAHVIAQRVWSARVVHQLGQVVHTVERESLCEVSVRIAFMNVRMQ